MTEETMMTTMNAWLEQEMASAGEEGLNAILTPGWLTDEEREAATTIDVPDPECWVLIADAIDDDVPELVPFPTRAAAEAFRRSEASLSRPFDAVEGGYDGPV